MKALLTIILLVTWVQANPVCLTFLGTISKLIGRGNYQEILEGARKASTEALKKPNPASLNDEQRKAVYFYTVEEPPFYKYLNQQLRNGKGAGEFVDYVDLLMSGLQEIRMSSPSSNTLWRIVWNQRLNHNVGDFITWHAFSSTTSDKKFIEGEDLSQSTLYEIRNAKGYYIKPYSEYDDEEEFLLPPNTKLELISGPTTDQKKYILRQTQQTSAMPMRLPCVSPGGAVSISMTVSRSTWIIAITVTYASVF